MRKEGRRQAAEVCRIATEVWMAREGQRQGKARSDSESEEGEPLRQFGTQIHLEDIMLAAPSTTLGRTRDLEIDGWMDDRRVPHCSIHVGSAFEEVYHITIISYHIRLRLIPKYHSSNPIPKYKALQGTLTLIITPLICSGPLPSVFWLERTRL